MYAYWQLAGKYLHYYLTASNGKGHGTHSPFIFNFITKVLNDKKNYPAYTIVEKLRSQLLTDSTVLTVEDMGAGSTVAGSGRRRVSSIAKHASKPKKWGQLLFRVVNYYRPDTILELGTSLGITTAYLAKANPAARVITMEGAKAVAEKAESHFRQLGIDNVEQVNGNFDDTLGEALHSLSSLDFVFIDGNHRREPTERYFQQLLPKTHNDTILVFDDIHWSGEMEKAWQTIRNQASVRCSVDLFFIGIVFFRQEFREKQHFTIRF
jgi:predicted O-methyltransferase YrrM